MYALFIYAVQGIGMINVKSATHFTFLFNVVLHKTLFRKNLFPERKGNSLDTDAVTSEADNRTVKQVLQTNLGKEINYIQAKGGTGNPSSLSFR